MDVDSVHDVFDLPTVSAPIECKTVRYRRRALLPGVRGREETVLERDQEHGVVQRLQTPPVLGAFALALWDGDAIVLSNALDD